VPASIDAEPSIIFEVPPDLNDRVVEKQLAQNPGSDFEQLIKAHGIDALGWYFPFHYQIAQHGIYISSAGALSLALRVFRREYSDNPSENLAKKLQYAAHAILRHESFHFAVECMAANWELAKGAACYIPATEKLRGKNGYIEDEEALANAYMIRGFRWINSTTRGARGTPLLRKFCAKQPPGYDRGPASVKGILYEGACRRLSFSV